MENTIRKAIRPVFFQNIQYFFYKQFNPAVGSGTVLAESLYSLYICMCFDVLVELWLMLLQNLFTLRGHT